MALWVVPLALFSLTLAADYSSVIVVNREATLTAEAMANAGATAFTLNPSSTSAQLNPVEARTRANELFPRAVQSGMLRQYALNGNPTVVATTSSVTVSVPVKSTMTIATMLVRFFSPGAEPITVRTVGRAQTDLCVPGMGIECVYPTDEF